MQIPWLLPSQLLHLLSSTWRKSWTGRAVWNVSSWNSVNAMTNLLTTYSRKPRSRCVDSWNQQPLVYVIFPYNSSQLSCFITARLLYNFCEFIHYGFQTFYSSLSVYKTMPDTFTSTEKHTPASNATAPSTGKPPTSAPSSSRYFLLSCFGLPTSTTKPYGQRGLMVWCTYIFGMRRWRSSRESVKHLFSSYASPCDCRSNHPDVIPRERCCCLLTWGFWPFSLWTPRMNIIRPELRSWVTSP